MIEQSALFASLTSACVSSSLGSGRRVARASQDSRTVHWTLGATLFPPLTSALVGLLIKYNIILLLAREEGYCPSTSLL